MNNNVNNNVSNVAISNISSKKVTNTTNNDTDSNANNNTTNNTINNTNSTTTTNTTSRKTITNSTISSATNTGPKNVFSTNLHKTKSTQEKMNKLKSQGKSLLLGGPKKECTICHKYIESHLHQIHVNAHPSQIFKWMYLGNFDTACNISDLRRLGITYVLNVASECKNTTLPKSIEQLHLKMKDLADFEVIDYFEKANDFFNKVRNSGKTMLVHCKYGVSRSPSFVAAYLIKYFGFNVDSALKFIRKKRPQINPNEGFLRQLDMYEKSLKAKGKKKK